MAGIDRKKEITRLLAGNVPPTSLGLAVGLGNLSRPGASLLGAAGLRPAPTAEPRTYPCFELYLDKKSEWRWRYRASNYKTIADSGEGYKNYEDASVVPPVSPDTRLLGLGSDELPWGAHPER